MIQALKTREKVRGGLFQKTPMQVLSRSQISVPRFHFDSDGIFDRFQVSGLADTWHLKPETLFPMNKTS